MEFNILNFTDGYKLDHRRQYPEGTELVYSNWTPRGSRIEGVNKVVFFGLQYFIEKYLIEGFNESFFQKEKSQVLKEYQRRIDSYLGPNKIGTEHIGELHDLGYLPLEIKALPEGSLVNLKVPMFTIKNTLPQFFWLTNYIETMLSSTIWGMCTSATIALTYKQLFDKYAAKTSDSEGFTVFQGHDFSMRGISSLESSILSGAGHLLSFVGTDTFPSIDFLEKYYGADAEKEMIGVSVSATEHSVMCMHGSTNELETFRHLYTNVYPTGILSIVSDTWDLWKVIGEILPTLKDEITKRDGKIVIRPDSGSPVHILTGYTEKELFQHPITVKGQFIEELESKGVVECLWDIFGGTVNSKGYKELDPHIGVIYGDGISQEKAKQILDRLERKGFASTNVVFGLGSYTYQYNTRDTFYFAFKSTYGIVNGVEHEIFKDPITDNGKKKSAKGLLKVTKVGKDFILHDQVTKEEEGEGELKTVFLNGVLTNRVTLSQVRKTLSESII